MLTFGLEREEKKKMELITFYCFYNVLTAAIALGCWEFCPRMKEELKPRRCTPMLLPSLQYRPAKATSLKSGQAA